MQFKCAIQMKMESINDELFLNISRKRISWSRLSVTSMQVDITLLGDKPVMPQTMTEGSIPSMLIKRDFIHRVDSTSAIKSI